MCGCVRPRFQHRTHGRVRGLISGGMALAASGARRARCSPPPSPAPPLWRWRALVACGSRLLGSAMVCHVGGLVEAGNGRVTNVTGKLPNDCSPGIPQRYPWRSRASEFVQKLPKGCPAFVDTFLQEPRCGSKSSNAGRFGPTQVLAGFWQHWPIRAKVGQHWPTLGTTWPTLFEIGPDLVYGANSSGTSLASTGFGAIWVKFGVIPAFVGWIQPNLVRIRPNLAQVRPKSGDVGRVWLLIEAIVWPELSRCWCQLWPRFERIWAMSGEFGLISLARFGQIGMISAEFGPSSEDFVFDQIWAISDMFSRSPPNVDVEPKSSNVFRSLGCKRS